MAVGCETFQAVRLLILAGMMAMISGCIFGRGSDSCSKPEEYQTSTSIPEIQVPEDLDKPDQTERLVIPPGETTGGKPGDKPEDAPCLEKPPDYFGRPLE